MKKVLIGFCVLLWLFSILTIKVGDCPQKIKTVEFEALDAQMMMDVIVRSTEIADTQRLLQLEVEKMPPDKKASVQAIYQAIAAQIEEVQGDDGKEITAIAKATLKFAMKDVPPKKRKKIQAYLDVMADGNLAYKYNEWAYEQYGDRLERSLEEMRNDPAFEEYNKKHW